MSEQGMSRSMRATVVGYWTEARPWQRLCYAVGAVLVLTGVAHGVAWLVVGGPWQGAVSFRKPFTFGVSFGLATATIAWVAGWLRLSDRAGWWLAVPLVIADTSEVVWVSLQRARGVASHFNFDTALDGVLFSVMGGAAVAVTMTVIVVVTGLALSSRLQAPPSMREAIRAGLLILLVAQVVGGWMIQHGVGPAGEGVTTGLTTFGDAGVMKVPHAVGMHGIQVLPALAWLLSFTSAGERRRLLLVRAAIAGYAALVAVSLLQTISGRAPLDVTVLATLLYFAGVALVAGAYATAALVLRRTATVATT